ncbi:MAG: hypothetical protein IPN20_21805 [Haliscomenobacter sp.]|nr:hypothetical protein [Haliscomenobacter sp.]
MKVLLPDSAFAKLLLRATAEVGLVESEPQRGAFDLLVPLKDGTEYYLELKMWCELKEGQIKKQTQDLKENQHAVYLLLGRSRYEWSKERVEQYPKAKRLSYEELLHALERYLELAASPELTELAGAYKEELEDQFRWLESAWKTVSRTDKNMALPYYYSAYAAIQKKLPPGIPTRIFTATNQGGEIIFSRNLNCASPLILKLIQ